MKTRILILLAITAVVTLSFTFVSVKSKTPAPTTSEVSSPSQTAPVGGFVMQDAL